LNYPRQAWGGWGITCRTAAPEIVAGSGAIGADTEGRPVAGGCGNTLEDGTVLSSMWLATG
jgi:hypothetical protein